MMDVAAGDRGKEQEHRAVLESTQLRDLQDYRSKQHQLYLERSKQAYLATGATFAPSSTPVTSTTTSTSSKPTQPYRPVPQPAPSAIWAAVPPQGSSNTTSNASPTPTTYTTRSPLAPPVVLPAQSTTTSGQPAGQTQYTTTTAPSRVVKTTSTYTTALPQGYVPKVTAPTGNAGAPSSVPWAQPSQVVRKVVSTTTHVGNTTSYSNPQMPVTTRVQKRPSVTASQDAELARKLQMEEDERMARELQNQADASASAEPAATGASNLLRPAVPRLQNAARPQQHPAEALGHLLGGNQLEAVNAAVRGPSLVRSRPQTGRSDDVAAEEDEQLQRALRESRLEHERHLAQQRQRR